MTRKKAAKKVEQERDYAAELAEKVARLEKTFTRPNEDGGEDEYALGVMYADDSIRKRCVALYERHGARFIRTLAGSIGGAVTLRHVAKWEKE